MRNPFGFLLLALTLIMGACSLNPNMQGKGEDYIQGEWQQYSTSVQKQLVSYSLYHFKFTCDSVYIKLKTFSKVNYGADTCMNSGSWTEYIRGTYKQQHDTLHIKGFFCNANYSLKNPGSCFRSGVYEEYFRVNKKTDSLIEITGTASVVPVNIHLERRVGCTIKPL